MDMDGFTINKKFNCKELALLKVRDVAAKSFFFDLGLWESDLSPKDKRTCRYVQTFLHKLPFGVPPGVNAFKISALEANVDDFYHEIKVDTNSYYNWLKKADTTKEICREISIFRR